MTKIDIKIGAKIEMKITNEIKMHIQIKIWIRACNDSNLNSKPIF